MDTVERTPVASTTIATIYCSHGGHSNEQCRMTTEPHHIERLTEEKASNDRSARTPRNDHGNRLDEPYTGHCRNHIVCCWMNSETVNWYNLSTLSAFGKDAIRSASDDKEAPKLADQTVWPCCRSIYQFIFIHSTFHSMRCCTK